MIMKLPDSGSWLAAALSGLGQTSPAFPDQTFVDNVSEAQLNEALDALVRGDIEFVILESGDAFLQVAGSGEGPYQVQHRAGGAVVVTGIAGDVDERTVRAVMQAYRRADSSWSTPHQWQKLE